MRNGSNDSWFRASGAVLTAAVVFTAVTMVGCRKRYDPPRVTIKGQTWEVEIADTVQARWEGLSGRLYLDESAGMLFIYPKSQSLSYCMRGCLVPLDIAFITADSRVAKIYTMRVEEDLAGGVAYISGEPVQFVLEVRGGALGQAGVSVGDAVSFSGDMPDPAKAEDSP